MTETSFKAYDQHVEAIALDVVKELDREHNRLRYEHQARDKRERERSRDALLQTRDRSVDRPDAEKMRHLSSEYREYYNFERVDLTLALAATVDGLLALGLIEDPDLEEMDEYAEPTVKEVIDRVQLHGQEARLTERVHSTVAERGRLVRAAQQRKRRPANEIVGDDAVKESMALMEYEELTGDLVTTYDWTQRRGDDGWEAILAPVQDQEWLQIVPVRELAPAERGNLSLDDWVFVWQPERMPADMTLAARTVKKPYMSRDWLQVRSHMPLADIAAECGASKATVARWMSALDVRGLPRGRPKKRLQK